jgi:hypothetical protein
MSDNWTSCYGQRQRSRDRHAQRGRHRAADGMIVGVTVRGRDHDQARYAVAPKA